VEEQRNGENRPVNPRRKRKTKMQIFKETYLPVIIAGVALILIIVFIIGSITRAVQKNRAEKEAEKLAASSQSEEKTALDYEAERLLVQAEDLAKNYDYQTAIDVLNSFSGDLSVYTNLNDKIIEYERAIKNLVAWDDPNQVVNLSFQLLIADPVRGFSHETYSDSINRNFITTVEFSKILQQLYNNGYILVDFDDFIAEETDANGTTVWTFFVSKWIAGQGYQKAMFYCAGIIIVMCIISFFLVESSPDDPLRSGTSDGKSDAPANPDMMTNKDFMKLPMQFILIAIYFIVAGTAHPITANIPAFADAKGFSAATGAAAYALCYAVMTPAKVGVGIVKDRFGAKVAVPIVFGFYILAILWVMLPVPESMYTAIGVFHGIGGTMSQLLVAYIVMDTYGKYYNPGAIGICLALFNIGRAIGMPAIHIGYDKTGSYTATMYIWLALAILTLFLAMLVLRMGKKWQAEHEAELAAKHSAEEAAAEA